MNMKVLVKSRARPGIWIESTPVLGEASNQALIKNSYSRYLHLTLCQSIVLTRIVM